jgi:hypothetical protein
MIDILGLLIKGGALFALTVLLLIILKAIA